LRDVLTFGRYAKKKYGVKVYKIPVSIAGFTCPNIDGTVARGGCVFCENESFSPNLQEVVEVDKKFLLNPKSSSNPFLELQLKSLHEQYRKTKIKLQKKFGAKKFFIYFQSFTNTYAPLETLKALYEAALGFEDVVGLSIGTRTDSIDEATLEYLKYLDKNSDIWLEFGIQSFYDETLETINRGHDSKNIEIWIKKAKEHNLKVCAHLIYGLPNETKEMMLNSLKKTLELNIDSLKIHPLYVVKNTMLTATYLKGKFTPISKDEYLEVLKESFEIIPEDIIIQRVSAGISDDTLLAPLWCKDKHTQMKDIRKTLKSIGLNY
jgi:radical SAM protein (TIGR01212 family)